MSTKKTTKNKGLGVPRPKKSGSGFARVPSPKKATAPSSRRSNPSRAWIPVADLKPLCDTTPGSLGIEVEILPKVHIGGFGPESTAFYGRRIDDRGCFYKYGARAYGITHWRALGIGVAATKERVGNPTGAKRSNAKPGASRATPKPLPKKK